jgi:hypothetical protein
MKTNTSLSTVNCHWKKLLTLVSAFLLGAALLAPRPVAAQAATEFANVRGSALVGGAPIGGVFSIEVTLLFDGSFVNAPATGDLNVRRFGRPGTLGSFSATVTSWSLADLYPGSGYGILILYAGDYTVKLYFFSGFHFEGNVLVADAVSVDHLGSRVFYQPLTVGHIAVNLP